MRTCFCSWHHKKTEECTGAKRHRTMQRLHQSRKPLQAHDGHWQWLLLPAPALSLCERILSEIRTEADEFFTPASVGD